MSERINKFALSTENKHNALTVTLHVYTRGEEEAGFTRGLYIPDVYIPDQVLHATSCQEDPLGLDYTRGSIKYRPEYPTTTTRYLVYDSHVLNSSLSLYTTVP